MERMNHGNSTTQKAAMTDLARVIKYIQLLATPWGELVMLKPKSPSLTLIAFRTMALSNQNTAVKSEPNVLPAPDTFLLSGVSTKGAEKLKQLQILHDGYKRAKVDRSVTFELPVSISNIINEQGQLQQSFLLPNGEQIGKLRAIGLSRPGTDPKLHEINYGKEDGGYWLKFSTVNKENDRKYSHVLISDQNCP